VPPLVPPTRHGSPIKSQGSHAPRLTVDERHLWYQPYCFSSENPAEPRRPADRAKGAAADAQAFRAAGIGDFDVFDFEREARRPDGTPVKVAFSLAFAADAKAPDTGFFTCQQHYPENFWNPAFQTHPNTVSGVAGVVFVADNPTDHHIFLSAFSGVRDLKATSTGITLETPRGEIQVMDPAAFRLHYAIEPPDVTRGMRLAAIRFSVRDMKQARALLADAAGRMDKLIVGPQAAHGATLVFEGT